MTEHVGWEEPTGSSRGQVAAGIGRLLDAACALLMAAVTALVFAQVLVRYVLGGSLVWSEELSRVLFVWLVLLAATRAAPMRIDFLVQAMPRRVGALVSLGGECVVVGLTLYLVWGAWGMADLTAGDSFIALGLSVSWVYYALVAAGLLWLGRSLLDGATYFAAAFGPDERTAP